MGSPLGDWVGAADGNGVGSNFLYVGAKVGSAEGDDVGDGVG